MKTVSAESTTKLIDLRKASGTETVVYTELVMRVSRLTGQAVIGCIEPDVDRPYVHLVEFDARDGTRKISAKMIDELGMRPRTLDHAIDFLNSKRSEKGRYHWMLANVQATPEPILCNDL